MSTDNEQSESQLSAEEVEARKRLQHNRGIRASSGLRSVPEVESSLDATLHQELKRRRGKPLYSSARPLSRTLFSTIYPNMKDRGSGATIALLTQRWPEIVGKENAALCVPLKISKPPTGYVLVLEAISSAASLKLKYQADKILDRVNGACGANFKGLQLQQTSTSAEQPNTQTTPLRRLSEDEIKDLQSHVASVDNPKMRLALLKLGEAILRQKKPQVSAQKKRLNRLKSKPKMSNR
jgi:hypothetical protein